MGAAGGPIFRTPSEITSKSPNITSGTAAVRPNNINNTPYIVSVDTSTTEGPWVHVGTIYDGNEGHTNSAAHIWSVGLGPEQDTGIWQDSTTVGATPTFTDDFKSGAWSTMPFNQILIKDSGATQRNLLYTDEGEITSNNTSLADWFGSLSWLTNGSETSTSAYSNSRVTGLSITNFGVADPILDSGNKSVLLFKFGERDGVQDANKDRSMIAWHRHNASDNVDAPAGIGNYTDRSGNIDFRDIQPYVQRSDFPDDSITGGPYSVSVWIK